MGRIAGLAAADTRENLLRAAADTFAERGYDGTRVADIASAAGVSNGALYAHFASKADLLTAALQTHGRRLLADMFVTEPDRSITGMLLVIGQGLLQRRDARGYLVIEALVAARRDADVARPMRDYMAERGDWLANLIELAQSDGELDPAVSPNALAHFCLLLSMGSALVTPDLHVVDATEWAELLSRLVGALSRPGPVSAATATATPATATPAATTDRNSAMKVRIDAERCQGHGRCYDLVPSLFAADDEGFGQVVGDGLVPPKSERDARLAAANCPERAIELTGEQ